MSLPPLTFTGISSFSADLQTILNRAQQVASFPLQALQNDKTDLLQRKTLTGTLQTLATAFSTSLKNLATVGDARGIGGVSSDASKAAINTVTTSIAATYTLNGITSLAKAAAETSLHGYATETPVSPDGHVRLILGSNSYEIALTPEQNNLAGLRDAINRLGIGVTATVFTTGTGAAPNYLSLTASASGKTTLSLKDGATDLLTSTNQGANAEFKLNGVQVSKPTNLINDVIPGVSFTIAGTTPDDVTLTLASSRSKLSTALGSLVTAYNNMVDFLDTQVGPSAGLLSGSSLISGTASALRELTSFQGSGSIKSLAELGLELNNEGKLSLNSDRFNQIAESQLTDAFALVGNSASGIGSLINRFGNISDPVTGRVKLELDQFGITENRLNTQISTLTERINLQQQALRQRLQMADTLLATLESQQKTLEAQLNSLNLMLYGKARSMNTLHQIASRLEERTAEMASAGEAELSMLLKEGDRLRGQLESLRGAIRQDLAHIDRQLRFSDPVVTAAIIDCAG